MMPVGREFGNISWPLNYGSGGVVEGPKEAISLQINKVAINMDRRASHWSPRPNPNILANQQDLSVSYWFL